jgi:hypothetical protein
VRSRTFSGPYVPSTLQDRLRLAGLVVALVAFNTAAGGDLGRSAGAAVAVFVFNILYEIILSQKLKQYAVCPLIDLINHSSSETVSCYQRQLRCCCCPCAAVGVPGLLSTQLVRCMPPGCRPCCTGGGRHARGICLLLPALHLDAAAGLHTSSPAHVGAAEL